VVEAGDPEQVVKHPQHDYTKLLIGSIPIADPSRGWGDELVGNTEIPDGHPDPAGEHRSPLERR
jgi:ABC-type oligopeptide transport system ATPase subunit